MDSRKPRLLFSVQESSQPEQRKMHVSQRGSRGKLISATIAAMDTASSALPDLQLFDRSKRDGRIASLIYFASFAGIQNW